MLSEVNTTSGSFRAQSEFFVRPPLEQEPGIYSGFWRTEEAVPTAPRDGTV
jgi:hypothetical protein